jgi:type I restriction enzyme S subunit
MDTNLMTLSILTNDHTEYIYYWLYNFGLWRLADTTSVPQINNKHIIPFLIPLPPLKEQKAIADVLSDTDDLITTLQKLIDKKEKIKKGAMKKLLTGKERLPGFNGEWEEEELNSIADIYQPKTISQSKMKDTGYTVYGANGKIGYYDKYNHVLEQIILTCRGSTCGTINFTDKKSWITGNAMVINIDNNKNIHKKFFYFKLLSTSFEDLITGTGQPQITRQAFRGFKIYYPKKIEEQKAIAQILSDMDAEIEALNKKLEKYKKIKQGMMEELLTGRVRLV